jgi:hypothetical protein
VTKKVQQALWQCSYLLGRGDWRGVIEIGWDGQRMREQVAVDNLCFLLAEYEN